MAVPSAVGRSDRKSADPTRPVPLPFRPSRQDPPRPPDRPEMAPFSPTRNPTVDQVVSFGRHLERRLDRTAAVVTAQDDVADLRAHTDTQTAPTDQQHPWSGGESRGVRMHVRYTEPSLIWRRRAGGGDRTEALTANLLLAAAWRAQHAHAPFSSARARNRSGARKRPTQAHGPLPPGARVVHHHVPYRGPRPARTPHPRSVTVPSRRPPGSRAADTAAKPRRTLSSLTEYSRQLMQLRSV